MSFINHFLNLILTYQFLALEDVFEILIFYYAIYKISVWLNRENQRKFLLYFYAYLICIIITALFSFTTIYNFLLYGGPFVGIFFIVFHQERLQKNFVALNKIIPEKTREENNQWPEILMRGLLYAMNKDKSVVCILQKEDPLLLTIQNKIDAPLSLFLLTMIIDSPLFDCNKMMLIAKHILVGINGHASWEKDIAILDSELHQADQWLQDALLLSKKTDALIIRVNHKSRMFDVVCQGKLLEKTSSQTALHIIKNYNRVQKISDQSSAYMRHDDVFKYLQS